MSLSTLQQTLASTFAQAVAPIRDTLSIEVVSPGDPDYDDVRALYNGMIDKRPALIVRCSSVNDVVATVNFVRDHNVPFSIRGGGHHGAGFSSIDDGLMLDLSLMKGVEVDPIGRTVRVAGGSIWSEVDQATYEHGFATPSGIMSITGVGGLTLGGGVGHLSRKFGLTVDNLLEADVVLANGEVVTTNATSLPDLFWALRGGGGNFGVVTSFTFRLHEVKDVIAGPTFWPLDRTAEIMRWYQEFIQEAPEDLNGFLALTIVPPIAAFPAELHGRKVCAVVWCYTGSLDQADDVLAPIRAKQPVVDGMQPMPFPAINAAFNADYPAGMQWYWKADFFRELSDEAIDTHIAFAEAAPNPYSTMHLYPVNGAVHRVASSDTAFSYRDVIWAQVIVGIDPDPANAERISTWAQDYWEAVHPFSAGGAYVNMMQDEGNDRVRAAYQDNYPRLAAIKAIYDPANLFRANQNILPGPDVNR
jgi:FAD/FMN-containing dehydrogenase